MSADEKKLPETQPNTKLQLQGEVLVERLKLGDPEAWTMFVQSYAPGLRESIRRSLAKRQMSQDRADDVEQEVWRFVKKRINEFQYQTDAKTHNWLANVAMNCVRTMRHEEQRGNPVSLDEIMANEHDDNTMVADRFFYKHRLYMESAEQSAEIELQRAQLRRELLPILERALRELSARDREIVVRRLINKEKPADLAKRFDLKTANIYQIVSRAKNSMRAYLRARGFLDSAK